MLPPPNRTGRSGVVVNTRLDQRTNVFAVPHDGGYIVYAPLAGRIIHANGECVAQLRRYVETRDPSVVGEAVVRRLGGLGWLDDPAEPVPLPFDRHYHPTSVTLFLTNRCNLRCTYCYAEAGEFEALEMAPEVYRAAIDLVVRNGQRAGRPAGVGFHGGGEPTMAWRALTGAVEYARSAVGDKGVSFAIATNGVMTQEKAEYVATNFSMVTLSFDGPPDVQDQQRPFCNGTSSFDAVMSFVEVLERHGTPFVIRSTVTEHSLARQAETVGSSTSNRSSTPGASARRPAGPCRPVPLRRTSWPPSIRRVTAAPGCGTRPLAWVCRF